ncbi:hypothetical protein CPHLJ_3g3810 [Cryptosporidium parvum]|uniref:AP complex subunit sigma n=2 Tax=Cryptosporidium parvum TaxID=5807 RepID=A0A7S7RHA2_CRYPV|nr:Clathrin adaptor complex small chain [Cryptosporidium parvum]TRY52399.1 Clathrin adaptor complex small chain [Cryptosporidium tyzzeri]WKS77131.1 hypothetical protein CPCDC_3g3810 [Cryptosporidium sp. 43IA8]WRK31622.1 Clathrin adaptor complex small chain [Cryptosporidium parvum]|eukprot:QOY42733.1 hypothetical protein CPATCC_001405 [Cryptosporidium parvum]
MIHFFIIQNLSGSTIFSKWYNSENIENRNRLQEAIKERLSCLEEKHLSYFTLGDTRIIFKKYKKIFMITGVDFDENILLMLATIQLINEAFGSHSRDISDVDVIYNNKKYMKIIDEIILGGEVIGTSMKNIKGLIK